jgi:cobalt-zinc-cadmium efflux system protein
MKSERNILVAFLLNLAFSVFELIGGFFTNSIAIISDAVHDLGDATSIGIAYFLERKSKKQPDKTYTYGYSRYSILGAIITNTILIVGSVFVIASAVKRIINPEAINYNGMIIFAIIGVVVNLVAAYVTKDGDSLNQKAVNLHMLEDVLGWIVVLVGAVVIKFTELTIIDSIMSIVVALFILINAIRPFRKIGNLFLVKIPDGIEIDKVKKSILAVENVKGIHHVHIWSMDGVNNYATMHVVSDVEDTRELKCKIKEELKTHGVFHVTIEFEKEDEICSEVKCHVDHIKHSHCHHHHH